MNEKLLKIRCSQQISSVLSINTLLNLQLCLILQHATSLTSQRACFLWRYFSSGISFRDKCQYSVIQETTNSNWKLAGDRDVTAGIVAINEQGGGAGRGGSSQCGLVQGWEGARVLTYEYVLRVLTAWQQGTWWYLKNVKLIFSIRFCFSIVGGWKS